MGNQFTKATLVKPGFPFTIVENTSSQRKSPTAIAFTNEQRVYGPDAVMQSSSNPQKTFAYVRDLLGMEYNDKNLETLRKQFYNFNDIVADERGYIAFKVDLKTAGETKSYVFTVEEILAMLLSHLKFLAEKQSKGSVKDVFLTVPTSFTMNQRRMLNDAVELADLKCIGMTEENIAAAITYGVDRKDDNQTHTAMFLNLGSSDFEVTIANFYAQNENKTDKYGNVKVGDMVENIEILSQVSDNRVSGRLFDFELLNILAEHFNSLKTRVGKPDIRENPRIVNRLLKEVPKIKDTLSANKEMIVTIPEVADYENLKMLIQRTDFEEKIDKYMKYLHDTVTLALEKAKVQIDQLSTVEIIGGALRVPKVKDVFTELLGDQQQLIGSHINGDESMTFGASFLGANISTSFKVRKLFLHQSVDEPIYVNITSLNSTEGGEYVQAGVLTEGDLKARKKFKIQQLDDLKVDFYTQSKGLLHTTIVSGAEEVLESFEYKSNGTSPVMSLEVSISPTGVVEVNTAIVKFDYTKMELKEQRILVNNTKTSEDNTQSASNSTNTETVSNSTHTESASNSTDAGSQASNSTKSEEANSEDEDNDISSTEEPSKAEAAKSAKPVYNTVYNTVPVRKTAKKQMKLAEVFIGHQPMSQEQKTQARLHLEELDHRDKVIIDTQKAKNDFEALIYSSREFATEEENQVYSTIQTIEELLVTLEKDENWLYEEGYNEKYEVYMDKINQINSTVSAIKYRKDEHHLREELIPSAQAYLRNFTSQIEAFSKRFPWVEDYKIRKVKEMATNATTWLNDTMQEQEKLQLNEDPVLKTEELKEKIYPLGYLLEQLSKTPKPKDWDMKHRPKLLKRPRVNNSTVNNSTSNNSTKPEVPETLEDDITTDDFVNATESNTTYVNNEGSESEDFKIEDL